MKKEYIKLQLKDLIPYKNNPRKNDQAVPYVEESIEQVGYITPIVVDENNVIMAGHTRAKALLAKNGGTDTEEVDVLRVSGLTEEQKRKFRILDNKTNEFAEWDFDKLEKELADLDFGEFDFDFDLSSDGWETKQQTATQYSTSTEQTNKPNEEPTFTPEGVKTGEGDGNAEDPFLPEGYDDSEIQQYTDNQENYVVKKRVIITFLPEREQDLLNLLNLSELDKVVYDIEEILGE